MKKIMSVAIVAVMAATMSFAVTAPAQARGLFWPGAIGIGIAAGVVGYFVGTAMAEGFDRNWDGRWDRHHERCKARYRSYDPWTDTFRLSTGHHRLCRL